MIDKINGNGVYDLKGKSGRKKSQADQPYENTPGVKELKKDLKKSNDRKTQEAKRTDQKTSVPGQGGVILDLSAQAAQKQKSDAVRTGSFAAVLYKLLDPVVRWLKNFWYDGGSQKAGSLSDLAGAELDPMSADTLPPLEPEGMEPDLEPGAEEAGLAFHNQIPAEILQSGNLSKVQEILTKNGERHLAHNSDLLTYYDRRGKFVSIDESEKNRVLYGDRNVHKL